MIIIAVLSLIALGVIIYMLIRLNDKIDQIDYRLFRLKQSMDFAKQESDKPIEEVKTEHIVPEPELSQVDAAQPKEDISLAQEDVEQDIVQEELEKCAPSIAQTVVEENVQPSSLHMFDIEEDNVAQTKRRLNIEKLVGENLFSKIGILALVIGIGFFVKFAIDNNWINQTYRTVLGVVTGFGLWGIAYKLRDSYRGFSSVLAGGGFAICFVSIAIAYNFYQLIPSWLTFASLVFLTAAMILISVKFDRRQLAMIAIIGGYIAPFMSASDSGSAITLLTYTAILNAAMFVVCIKKSWWILSVPGCVITWLIVTISPVKGGQNIVGLLFSVVFLIMFSLPLALAMWRDMQTRLFNCLIVTSVINMFAFTGLALRYIDNINALNGIRGIIPLIVAGLNTWIFIRYYRMQNIRLMHNLLLGSIIVFVIMSVIVQFSNPSITAVFFAVFVMALLEIYGRTSKKIFVVFGSVLAIITFMILNAKFCSNISNATLGGFTTMLACGLCYFGYAIIMSRSHEVYRRLLPGVYESVIAVACFAATYIEGWAVYSLMHALHAPEAAPQAAAVMIMGCLLFMSTYFKDNDINRLTVPGIAITLFVMLNYIPDSHNLMTEIFQWLSACLFICVLVVQTKSILIGNQSIEAGSRKSYIVYYSIVGSVFVIAVTELLLRSASLTVYYSAGFSIALIINGAALLALGMRYKCITVRFIGLGMFGLLLLKLVIYDLWLLPMIGRIIVFILLGAVLLILSFMYQRLRSKLFDK